MQQKIMVVLLVLLMIVPLGCAGTATATPTVQAPQPTAEVIVQAVPSTATPNPTSTTNLPIVVAQPTLEPALAYAIASGVPAGIRQALADLAPAGAVEHEQLATVQIGPSGDGLAAQYVYVPVAAFPTLADGIGYEELLALWQGKGSTLASLAADSPITLYMTQDTLDALTLILGGPADAAPVSVVLETEIIQLLWDERPAALGIVGFDELDPQLKVLPLDGQNPLLRELDLATYPLVLNLYASGPAADLTSWEASPATNRDLEKMTSLVMTGVTALVRAIAAKMEDEGLLYPAVYVSETLRSADITHISNEIPFSTACPPPNPGQDDLRFCSDPAYIELLRSVGTDIIELTGNHFQDYGSEATLMTLDMYREEGWPYFGGGEDLLDAQTPANLADHGNTFSFLGCNPVGPWWAFATNEQPGCLGCDWDYMQSAVASMARTADVPVVTFQYWEFYHYSPTPQQKTDFRAMVDAGAKIVSGSQAHHPQAIEFYNGSFIHYGLGNLFFDQMWSTGTRQIVMDRHTIYDGRHISTELLSYTLYDLAQPRPMTEAERTSLLTSLFQASGWLPGNPDPLPIVDVATPEPVPAETVETPVEQPVEPPPDSSTPLPGTR